MVTGLSWNIAMVLLGGYLVVMRVATVGGLKSAESSCECVCVCV